MHALPFSPKVAAHPRASGLSRHEEFRLTLSTLSPGHARDALRRATRDAHEAVDASFSRFDLSDTDAYRTFLIVHAQVVPALEAWLNVHQPDSLGGWRTVRRGPALLADLAALGEPAPPTVAIDLPDDTATICGATYVLEGSRMGGALLSRRVPAGLPADYLRAPSQSALWRSFVADLDRLLPDAQAIERAGAAALATFALFGKAVATA
ncbi:hypothetical protein BH10PSE13_BH10PSE13_16210 [soil metagenome]